MTIVKLESSIDSATFDLPDDLKEFVEWIKSNEYKTTYFLTIVERKPE